MRKLHKYEIFEQTWLNERNGKMKHRFFEFFIDQIAKVEKEKALELTEAMLGPLAGQLVWGFVRQQVAENWQNVRERILSLMDILQRSSDRQHISDVACHIATELIRKGEVPEDIVIAVVQSMVRDSQFCFTVKCWAEENENRSTLLMQLPRYARPQEHDMFKSLVHALKLDK